MYMGGGEAAMEAGREACVASRRWWVCLSCSVMNGTP